jgi:putative spermidine/putrescine transport system permease protein
MSFFMPGKAEPYDAIPTFGNYTSALGDSFQWWILWRTLKLGFLTTLFTLILGYPLAYNLAHAGSKVKGMLMVLLLSPLLVGVVIRSFGWMVLLADNGLINSLVKHWGLAPHGLKLMYNEFGVLVGTVHIYLPFMVLSLSGALENIPPDLELAARSLGASSTKAFWRIVFPLSLPGVFAGCLLVFVLAVSSYVIPVLLGGFKVITTPLLVVQTAVDVHNWPGAAAQAVILFAASLACIGLYFKLMNRAMRGLSAWTAVGGGTCRPVRHTDSPSGWDSPDEAPAARARRVSRADRSALCLPHRADRDRRCRQSQRGAISCFSA